MINVTKDEILNENRRLTNLYLNTTNANLRESVLAFDFRNGAGEDLKSRMFADSFYTYNTEEYYVDEDFMYFIGSLLFETERVNLSRFHIYFIENKFFCIQIWYGHSIFNMVASEDCDFKEFPEEIQDTLCYLVNYSLKTVLKSLDVDIHS